MVYLALALGVIPIGLIARRYRGEPGLAPPTAFVTDYLGDTLWAVMFFFLFAALLVRWRSWSLLVLTLGFTVGIEVSQLYPGEPLRALRDFPPTGFMLGSSFLWSDVFCLVVGTVCAAALHQAYSVRTGRCASRAKKHA